MQQNYVLEIGGKAAGRFFAFSGEGTKAAVVSVRIGSSVFQCCGISLKKTAVLSQNR
jgi:hypothetical protein